MKKDKNKLVTGIKYFFGSIVITVITIIMFPKYLDKLSGWIQNKSTAPLDREFDNYELKIVKKDQ